MVVSTAVVQSDGRGRERVRWCVRVDARRSSITSCTTCPGRVAGHAGWAAGELTGLAGSHATHDVGRWSQCRHCVLVVDTRWLLRQASTRRAASLAASVASCLVDVGSAMATVDRLTGTNLEAATESATAARSGRTIRIDVTFSWPTLAPMVR
jgi:hypothetical protein